MANQHLGPRRASELVPKALRRLKRKVAARRLESNPLTVVAWFRYQTYAAQLDSSIVSRLRQHPSVILKCTMPAPNDRVNGTQLEKTNGKSGSSSLHHGHSEEPVLVYIDGSADSTPMLPVDLDSLESRGGVLCMPLDVGINGKQLEALLKINGHLDQPAWLDTQLVVHYLGVRHETNLSNLVTATQTVQQSSTSDVIDGSPEARLFTRCILFRNSHLLHDFLRFGGKTHNKPVDTVEAEYSLESPEATIAACWISYILKSVPPCRRSVEEICIQLQHTDDSFIASYALEIAEYAAHVKGSLIKPVKSMISALSAADIPEYFDRVVAYERAEVLTKPVPPQRHALQTHTVSTRQPASQESFGKQRRDFEQLTFSLHLDDCVRLIAGDGDICLSLHRLGVSFPAETNGLPLAKPATAPLSGSMQPFNYWVNELPSGQYLVKVNGAPVRPENCRLTTVANLPCRERFQFATTIDGFVALNVLPPREIHGSANSDDYRAAQTLALKDGCVYVESFGGSAPTELLYQATRDFPDHKVVLGVRDFTTNPFPLCTNVVYIGTPQWAKMLATAKVIIVNDHLPFWFAKRPGQRMIQTWHGKPEKLIGVHTPRQCVSESYRRAIATQAGMWDELYVLDDIAAYRQCSAFNYQGTVNTDADITLLTAKSDKDEIRSEVRDFLGIASEDHVVLIAPTWIDQPRGFKSDANQRNLSQMMQSARLHYPDSRFLLRLHHSQRGFGIAEDADDVSDFFALSHLLAAVDLVITDYSSIASEAEFTGTSVKRVQPLDEYFTQIRGIYDDLSS